MDRAVCVGGLNKLRIIGAFMPVIAALSRWFAVRVGLEPKAAASEHASSTVLGMHLQSAPLPEPYYTIGLQRCHAL